MKILHIGKYLPPAKGGMENSILYICRQLNQYQEIDVVLVGTNGLRKNVEHDEKFKIRSLKTWWTLASTPLLTGLRKIIKEEKPDLIHVHLPNPWITLMLKGIKIPMVATYHCDIVSFPVLKKLYSPILHSFLRHCVQIVTTSPQLGQASLDIQPYQKKIRMIPLSVPPIMIKDENIKLTESLKTLSENRMVLFVGRLVSYKGLTYLLEAMKKVDGHLVIVGEGGEKEDLQELVKKNLLSKKVTFAGFVTDQDLVSYYQAAKLVVLSSVNEGEALGICLIEGLAMGRPLVTTNLATGVSFVNEHEITGLVVPARDSSSLASAIQRIMNHPEDWKKFSENARLRYDQEFDLKKIVEQHLKMYREVLQK